MATFTISLPNSMAGQIDQATKTGGFATRSEFFRTLLRKYFTRDLEPKVFIPRPLDEIRTGFEKTGKYDAKFINSVMKGLAKSSFYNAS